MSSNELQHLPILAEIDDLLQRVRRWKEHSSHWAPARKARLVLSRVLDRVGTLQLKLESPLIVATFGGTGTGKSTLVNALVGQDVSESGRQRPTTTTPVLLVRPGMSISELGLDAAQFTVKVIDAPILRDLVLIDCPDPDTSETAERLSNIARLRAIVPLCDVLLIVSTQQKYRSARVTDELSAAASGCRLVFVQTHADQDSDVREDWRRSLAESYEVPDLFFVDSRRAIAEQESGHRPSGDFGRLLDLLTNQFGVSKRVAIRRSNVLDLLDQGFSLCRTDYQTTLPQVAALKAQLAEQRRSLTQNMTEQLRDELLQNRNLWERRLLSAVTDLWGFSPFSAVLRFYNGLGAFIASFSFFRARSSAQMALIGAVQGARWLKSRTEALDADATLDRAAALSIADSQLQEARLVITGYLRSAEIEVDQDARSQELSALRRQAVQVEGQFLVDARRAIDALIDELAERQCSWLTRARYELLFAAYLGLLTGRVGYNFFWSSFLCPIVKPGTPAEPLLTIDFYIPAILFLLIWSGLLVCSFVWRLRRGLAGRINKLAQSMVHERLSGSLFPDIERNVAEIETDERVLCDLSDRTMNLRSKLAAASSNLGGVR